MAQTTKQIAFNQGIEACTDKLAEVISDLYIQQGREEGFAFHVTGTKIAFAEELLSKCLEQIDRRQAAE